MAKVYITEYANTGGNAALEPAQAHQTITSSGTSGQTSAFDATTNFIRVHTDGIVSIAIGSNPTATTSTTRLAANQTEYFCVRPGHKLAVITNT
jgi:hypothetical protein